MLSINTQSVPNTLPTHCHCSSPIGSSNSHPPNQVHQGSSQETKECISDFSIEAKFSQMPMSESKKDSFVATY